MRSRILAALWVCSLAPALSVAQSPAQEDNTANTTLSTPGSVRLRQPARAEQETQQRNPRNSRGTNGDRSARGERAERLDTELDANGSAMAPQTAGEFELFVQRQSGNKTLRRFGADLLSRGTDDDALEAAPLVPSDYVVAPGDEVLLTLWGSVDADLRLTVDRTGRITIPRVGSVQVAGVRHGDLTETISRRVAQTFKNFQISATLGALRGIRIFVTGFASNPGAYTVGSLTTLTGALLRAGGPATAGSFRRIELRRGPQLTATFDLYSFLLNGDRSADRLLQSGDVIHVAAVGDEIGLVGSVNKPGIYELKPNETVADALRMAGGFSAVADRSRIAVERLSDRKAAKVRELALPADLQQPVSHGDILRVFSAVDAVLPVQLQNKRVKIEGEVARPGDYVLPPNSNLQDAIKAAGGLTSAAFVFGAEFSRESVRITQQLNYERALRDLETEVARQGTQRTSNADEAAGSNARSAATTRLVERLRAVKPSGRIVLQMATEGGALPELALEDGDRLMIPARPTTVGVFGSVFNGGSYLITADRRIDDYLRLAGGPTRGADQDSTFLIRANGSVISNMQSDSSWLRSGQTIGQLRAEPGDTIFVPEELNKTTFVQSAKDWTQILYQFGLGIAGIKAVGL